MSDLLSGLKLDKWWKAVILIGCSLLSISLIQKVEIVERKHLLGLSIGLILIGFSNWIAQKNNVNFGYGGMFQWKSTNHNLWTFLLLLIGVILFGLFGFLIVKSLI